ncbi:hypothetical protein AVEN_133935-1 [Araneus ventricosus]|uniref:Uncharacterized protein n=1 Tax=Araneus ventricosus TaxID=182803 RepID=A0A4Y2D5H1_ARAVE|nr:hypothetical protein AVEN_133935-1 [Araneus ventricosus]
MRGLYWDGPQFLNRSQITKKQSEPSHQIHQNHATTVEKFPQVRFNMHKVCTHMVGSFWHYNGACELKSRPYRLANPSPCYLLKRWDHDLK